MQFPSMRCSTNSFIQHSKPQHPGCGLSHPQQNAIKAGLHIHPCISTGALALVR